MRFDKKVALSELVEDKTMFAWLYEQFIAQYYIHIGWYFIY